MANKLRSILLQSGNLFDFDNPELSTFTVKDIAHNLSHICRFAGACDYYYSDAQHAYNTSLIVDDGFEFEALHHDDAEAFYGDMTTWLKELCPDYKNQLKRGEDTVSDFLGLPRGMSPQVKLADYRMLALEKAALFRKSSSIEGFHHLVDLDMDIPPEKLRRVKLEPMSPRKAKRLYMNRHCELLGIKRSWWDKTKDFINA
ncbi:MAG: hypothetical protein ACTHJR_18075 [Sphingomonas sp.]|uniref:hypothetical protein n=1 Tax=Sphingomonas sp. TaxID=28214 RepID=UPI003F7F5A50